MLCTLLACSGDGPMAVVAFGDLEGIWEMQVEANTSCDPDAIARTINFTIDTVNVGDGLKRIAGIWAIGPSAVGLSHDGQYFEDSQRLDILFAHTSFFAVVSFSGTVKRDDRIDGRIVAPPPGREPYWPVGNCEQKATARKVMEFPPE